MSERPHLTVAAVVERNGKFLMVEERTQDGLRLNQPAGHVEPRETLLEAVVRETLEETAYRFIPQHLLGVYHWANRNRGPNYVRFAFTGRLDELPQDVGLDADIIRTVWLSPAEVRDSQARHRSPLVGRCMEDFLRGQRYTLDLIRTEF